MSVIHAFQPSSVSQGANHDTFKSSDSAATTLDDDSALHDINVSMDQSPQAIVPKLEVTSQTMRDSVKSNYLDLAMGGIIVGAMVGSVFGPVGIAGGAIAGGLLGLSASLIYAKNHEHQKIDDSEPPPAPYNVIDQDPGLDDNLYQDPIDFNPDPIADLY